MPLQLEPPRPTAVPDTAEARGPAALTEAGGGGMMLTDVSVGHRVKCCQRNVTVQSQPVVMIMI